MKITLPELGEGINDVEITELLVEQNSTIKKDDILMVVESDKASMEIPSDISGTIKEVLVNKGDTINPGDNLFEITTDSNLNSNTAPTKDLAKDSTDEDKKNKESENSSILDEQVNINKNNSRNIKNQLNVHMEGKSDSSEPQIDNALNDIPKLATPSIRKLARELGCDLGSIVGTAKNNRITREDVLNHANQRINTDDFNKSSSVDNYSHPGQDENSDEQNNAAIQKVQIETESLNQAKSVPSYNDTPLKRDIVDEKLFLKYGAITKKSFNKIKKVTATRMTDSWISIPHVTHFDEIDIDHLIDLKKELESVKKGIKVSYLSFILKALTKALKEQKIFNSTPDIDNSVLIMKEFINIGVAADTPKGLVVPVIHNIDKLSVKKINDQIFELSQKAKDGKLTMEEMSGGTFTVSSLGGIGGKFFTPIINKPEVAIMGISRMYKRVVLDKYGLTKELNMLPFSLSYDHRVIDGADAARFCNLFKSLLTNLETFD